MIYTVCLAPPEAWTKKWLIPGSRQGASHPIDISRWTGLRRAHSCIEILSEGCKVGPADKAHATKPDQFEFGPQNPSDGKIEPTPASCPLTSIAYTRKKLGRNIMKHQKNCVWEHIRYIGHGNWTPQGAETYDCNANRRPHYPAVWPSSVGLCENLTTPGSPRGFSSALSWLVNTGYSNYLSACLPRLASIYPPICSYGPGPALSPFTSAAGLNCTALTP